MLMVDTSNIPQATLSASKRFVELINQHKNNPHWIGLNSEELDIARNLLQAAGFSVKRIYHDDHESTYRRNTYLCHCIISTGNEQTDIRANGWLNDAFKYTLTNPHNVSIYALTEILAQYASFSVPFKPITVNEDGEQIGESEVVVWADLLIRDRPDDTTSSNFPFFVRHLQDDHAILGYTFQHIGSKGCFHLQVKPNVSATHHAIFCKTCGLRCTFPNTIITFGELREFFKNKLRK